ncbi:MAG: ribosome small subunit-dependent GTPase A [Clostridia bacterium]|nr:ribosome small subunit-dependent GTPase A [Clostridia bacterium]
MFDIQQYGYNEAGAPPGGLLPGRVTELRREQYTVITERGEAAAFLKGSFHYAAAKREDFPCVGDFVFLQYNDSGPSQIVQLLPRRSKFSRADFSGHGAGYAKTVLEQVIAANFDVVFITTSLNKDFKVSRIARYLVQARRSGGQAVVLLTKADLACDADAAVSAVRMIAPGVPVHAVSSRTGIGMDALNEYLLPGKTAVFLGMSGVGKTSLLNALMGWEAMAVRPIREDDDRGRHTTTRRQLFMLPSGAMVIDTPGMRELGLFDANEGIGASFSDVEELFMRCRFTDCGHQREPGCAVVSALADGSLTQERWERYRAQKRENEFADGKARYLREKRRRDKDISKFCRQYEKHGGKKR